MVLCGKFRHVSRRDVSRAKNQSKFVVVIPLNGSKDMEEEKSGCSFPITMVILVALVLAAGVVLGACCGSKEPDPQANADSQVIAEGEFAGQIVANLTSQEAYDILEEAKGLVLDDASHRDDFHVMDVRSFQQCELEGVISTGLVPVDFTYFKSPESFRNKLVNLDKNRTYLVYSKKGVRSAKAFAILGELGFMKVYNMLGGLDAWSAAGLPTALVGECG